MVYEQLAPGEAGAPFFIDIAGPRGKRVKARCRMRLWSGVYVWAAGTGGTKRAALDRLDKSIAKKLGQPAGAKELSGDTPMYVVAGQFFTQLDLDASRPDATTKVKQQSVDSYRYTWQQYLRPHVAELKLREVTPIVCERVLDEIREGTQERPGSESKAKRSYVVLNKILTRAVTLGGIAINPLASITAPNPIPKPVVAMDAFGVGQVRAALRQHEIDRRAGSKARGGPPPRGDLVALVDLMFGTGLRIGEALALRWCDVIRPEGGDSQWLVDVNATIVEIKGQGQFRQPMPKTTSGDRLVPVPPFVRVQLETMLANQILIGEDTVNGYVFAARRHKNQTTQQPRNRKNTSRSLRDALTAQGLYSDGKGFHPHLARRTVATVVARATGNEAIAGQLLGHKVSSSVTATYYIERVRLAPDETATIQAFIELSEQLVPLPSERRAPDTVSSTRSRSLSGHDPLSR